MCMLFLGTFGQRWDPSHPPGPTSACNYMYLYLLWNIIGDMLEKREREERLCSFT